MRNGPYDGKFNFSSGRYGNVKYDAINVAKCKYAIEFCIDDATRKYAWTIGFDEWGDVKHDVPK